MYRVDSFEEKKHYLKYAMPFAFLCQNPPVILNKDGSMEIVWRYRGPDLDSAVEEQLAVITAQLNSAFLTLGTGYVLYFEAQRKPSRAYPKDNFFPDEVTREIDEERKNFFESGVNYESNYFMTLYWMPPSDNEGKIKEILIEGHKTKAVDVKEYIASFLETADKLIGFFRRLRMPASYLSVQETVSYLHSVVSSKEHAVEELPSMLFFDGFLYDSALSGGLKPKLDDLHLRVVVPLDYPPISRFGLFDELNQLDFSYRWITRFFCLDKADALSELNAYQKGWNSKVKSAATLLKELFRGYSDDRSVNENALGKVEEVKEAIRIVEGDEAGYGFFSTLLVLFDKNEEAADEKAKAVEQIFMNLGIKAKIEDLNAVDAWLGSIPGNVGQYVRRPLLSTANLVHLLPITDVWAGPEKNDHFKAPCLMYTRSGNTPFRLNLHVGDVGHTLLIGPTGAGKSVHLNLIAAQFRRYKDAQIFIFDKGASSRILTEAVGGNFFDIANEDAGKSLSFQPLSQIDGDNERSWAAEWICGYIQAENVAITPEVKRLIDDALEAMAAMPPERRTLSLLISSVQDKRLKDALRPLSLEGNYGRIFDSDHDTLRFSTWQSFEMEKLMSMPGLVGPTLLYLFHRIEQQLDGRPTLLILDESWIFFDHPMFCDKIREWLKVLRKFNASVVFATQSLADVVTSKIFSTILESCKSKIFLPNDKALEKTTKEQYASFGLNGRQLQIIATAIPKKQYYYTSPLGSRLYDLALGEKALAYVAVNKQDLKKCRQILDEYGKAQFASKWRAYKRIEDEREEKTE